MGNIENLKQQYIELGGNPNSSVNQAGLAAARKRGESRRDKTLAWAGKLATRGLALVSVLFTVFIVLAGLAVSTVLMVIAETQAVNDGLAVVDPRRSGLYSLAIVSIYIVLLFVREVLASGQDTQSVKWSLRLTLRDIGYMLGISHKWKIETKGSLANIESVLRAVLWAVVISGLLGRLSMKLTSNLSWHAALVDIVTNSTLKDFVGYVVTPMTAIALLLATKFTVKFIFMNFTQVTGGLESNFLEDYSIAEIEDYWSTQVARLKSKQLPSNNEPTTF